MYTVFHGIDGRMIMSKRFLTGIISTVLIFSVLFAFTGCNMLSDAMNSERFGAKKLAKQDAEQVFEYLKNKDIDSLCEVFSEDSRKYHDLEIEWEIFFDRIDGNIVSYKSISFPGEGMSFDNDGEISDSHLSVNFNGVKTDTGAVYDELGYYQTRIDTANPELEGINVFTVKIPETGRFIEVGGFSSEYDV